MLATNLKTLNVWPEHPRWCWPGVRKAPVAVFAVGSVVKERLTTDGRVVEACGVAKKRTNTVGRVVATDRVAKERLITVGGVGGAFCIAEERECPIGCVKQASRVAQKRRRAGRRIFVCGVGEERSGPGCRVELAFCVASEGQNNPTAVLNPAGRETQKGGLPLCRVASRVASIRRLG